MKKNFLLSFLIKKIINSETKIKYKGIEKELSFIFSNKEFNKLKNKFIDSNLMKMNKDKLIYFSISQY